MPIAVNQSPSGTVDRTACRLVSWLHLRTARLLWPARCLACGDAGDGGIDLCPPCLTALPRLRHACVRCALPLPGFQPEATGLSTAASGPATGPVCGACLMQSSPLEQAHAAVLYAPPIDRLLPRFKFHGDLAAGRLLAQLMVEAVAGLPRPAALIPVPLHRGRLRQRGYDQALELARPLARSLDVPLLARVLRRVRCTAPQSRLDAGARRRNLRNAFAVVPAAALPDHVVLVDDVMTTGATLHAAAVALRRAGVRRVDAWVAARAP